MKARTAMMKSAIKGILCIVWLGLCVSPAKAGVKPLKVYILAGQSNMQGHAKISTFDHIGMDPKTAPILKAMRHASGKARVCKRVWISSIGCAKGEQVGRLTAGYGHESRGPKIGPEFTFGIYMQKFVGEPILIIKTAWGGKSLHTDFRSPGAGPYQFNPQQLARLKKNGQDPVKAKAEKAKATGHYYRLMLAHINKVLKDIKRVCPVYKAQAGYELAGFVWFQGWNDMCDQGVYPDRGKLGGYGQYSKLLAHFIRDVRKALAAPKMPFVIGVLGAGGPIADYGPEKNRYKGIHQGFRQAMAAPGAMPEFRGNVKVVLTEKCWDLELDRLRARGARLRAKNKALKKDKDLTPAQRKKALAKFRAKLYSSRDLEILKGASNADYHYMGSGKVMALIGKAFAEALR